MKTMLANQTAVPDFAFCETLIHDACARTTSRRRRRRAATVDEWNLDKSLAFYKDRFADASDFTFVFVGSFDLRDDEAARRALSRRPAVHPPQGDVEGRRRADADRRRSRRRSRRASSRRARRRSCSAGRSSTTRRSGSRSARWRRSCRPGCSRRFARISAAPTASRAGAEYQQDARCPTIASRSSSAAIRQRTDDLVDARVPGDRAASRRTARPRSRSTTSGKRCCATSRPTAKQNGYLLTQISLKYQFGEDPATLWDDPGLLQEARRRDDSAGGADVSRGQEPRQGDADAGEEIGDRGRIS